MPEKFVEVAQTNEIRIGELKQVTVGDEEIMLTNIDGTYYAVSDSCTHAYVSLSESDLEGEEVECNLHGSRFNVKTGEALLPPAEEPLTVYQVKLEGSSILVGPPKS